MLRTRLWMGALLIGLGALVLAEGWWFAPYYPFLFVSAVAACSLAARELLHLFPAAYRPNVPFCVGAVVAVVAANWVIPLGLFPSLIAGPWHVVGAVFVATLIVAFLLEMAKFRGPDHATERIALTVFTIAYLGLLPSFLLQIRWPHGEGGHDTRWLALAFALAVFVPKFCDIGAYFTGKFLAGRVLGRHPMTPILSPKKTWEGAVGGLVMAALIAVLIDGLGPVFGSSGDCHWMTAAAFGVTVAVAGQLGDLAESLLKRDCQTKDASQSVPGFGGVLDVIDSLLFAAPVAYWWLRGA